MLAFYKQATPFGFSPAGPERNLCGGAGDLGNYKPFIFMGVYRLPLFDETLFKGFSAHPLLIASNNSNHAHTLSSTAGRRKMSRGKRAARHPGYPVSPSDGDRGIWIRNHHPLLGNQRFRKSACQAPPRSFPSCPGTAAPAPFQSARFRIMVLLWWRTIRHFTHCSV